MLVFLFVQKPKNRGVVANRTRVQVCFGNDFLTELLTEYAAKKETESLKVGIVGENINY